MKSLLATLLSMAALLLLPAASHGQERSNSRRESSAKPRVVAALVSSDARSFQDSHQHQWLVANPEAVSAFANQRVKVKYLLAAGSRQVQIVSVKLLPGLSTVTTHPSDSAFRR